MGERLRVRGVAPDVITTSLDNEGIMSKNKFVMTSPFDTSSSIRMPKAPFQVLSPVSHVARPYGDVSDQGLLVHSEQYRAAAVQPGLSIPVLGHPELSGTVRKSPPVVSSSIGDEATSARRTFLGRHLLGESQDVVAELVDSLDPPSVKLSPELSHLRALPYPDAVNSTRMTTPLSPPVTQPHVMVQGPVGFTATELSIINIETTLLSASSRELGNNDVRKSQSVVIQPEVLG
jgi:hypothetical protein